MILSVVVGMLLMPFAGKFADSVRPSITLPCAFLFRACTCVAFRFIKNPGGIFAYAVSILLVTATGCETICVDTLLYRQSDREIRGVVFGFAMACGFTGQLIFSASAGYLYDYFGVYTPFELVGALDLFMVCFILIMVCCGAIKNDLAKKPKKKVLLEKDPNLVI